MFSQVESKVNPVYLGNRMKRFLAFCVDIFPINFIVITIYRQFSEYDTLMEPLMADPSNAELQAAIMPMMNTIGMIGGGIYLIYCFLMEASDYQATFGKKLFRLKVVSKDGELLTPQEAFWRNAFKILSHALMSLGFFWILFDKQKRGLHDIMGKTLVVEREFQNEEVYVDNNTVVNSDKELIRFKSIYSGNQSNLLFPADITSQELKEIQNNHPLGEKVDGISRLTEYLLVLNDDLITENLDMDEDLFWNNLTLGQKVVRVFCSIDSWISIRSLEQFYENQPELIFAVSEMLNEINAKELRNDYLSYFVSICQEDERYDQLITSFDRRIVDWQEPWETFCKTHEHLKTKTAIKDFYNNEDYHNALETKVCEYIESNIDMFINPN